MVDVPHYIPDIILLIPLCTKPQILLLEHQLAIDPGPDHPISLSGGVDPHIVLNVDPLPSLQRTVPGVEAPPLSHIHMVDVVFSREDRKSTRLNSSHVAISYAVFCLKKKKHHQRH